MRDFRLLLMALLVLGFSPLASAVVLDFETGSIDSNGLYTEDGFDLQTLNFTGNNAALQSPTNPGNGTRLFAFCAIAGTCTPGTELSLTDGSTFALNALDAANWTFEGQNGLLDVIGHVSGGGTVSQQLVITDVWQTFTLTGFNNLVSVQMYTSAVYAGAIDNLVLNSSVPEPLPLALLALGLMLTAVRRRFSA